MMLTRSTQDKVIHCSQEEVVMPYLPVLFLGLIEELVLDRLGLTHLKVPRCQ